MEQLELQKKTTHGFVWKLLEKISGQIIILIIQIILARILAPEEYGIVGLLTIFITISDVFILQGLTTSLIQKKNADDLDFSSVFYANIVLSVVLYAILFFIAPVVGNYYDNDNLVGFMRVLSLNVIIGAIPAVSNAILSRNLDFKKSFFRNLANSLTQASVGIPLALLGFGAWSMVLCKLAGTVVGSIVLFLSVGWWPKKQFSFLRCKQLFKYSSKVLGSNLLNTIFNNLNAILIGHYYSTTDVGYYQRGSSIPTTVMVSTDGAMSETLYPSFSKNQDNLSDLKESVRKSVQISMFLCSPILMGLLIVARPLTIVLLTEKWLPSVPYMQLSCLICLFWPLSHRTHALNAIGKSGITFLLNILSKGLIIIWIAIFIKKGIQLLMLGSIVISVISFVISSLVMKKYIKYGLMEAILDVLPPLIMCGIMVGSIYFVNLYLNVAAFVLLIINVFIGVFIYCLLSLIFKPNGFMMLMNGIRNYRRERNGKKLQS